MLVLVLLSSNIGGRTLYIHVELFSCLHGIGGGNMLHGVTHHGYTDEDRRGFNCRCLEHVIAVEGDVNLQYTSASAMFVNALQCRTVYCVACSSHNILLR